MGKHATPVDGISQLGRAAVTALHDDQRRGEFVPREVLLFQVTVGKWGLTEVQNIGDGSGVAESTERMAPDGVHLELDLLGQIKIKAYQVCFVLFLGPATGAEEPEFTGLLEDHLVFYHRATPDLFTDTENFVLGFLSGAHRAFVIVELALGD